MDQPTEEEIQSIVRGSDSAAKERLVKYFEREGAGVVGGLSNSTMGLVLGMVGNYMRGETEGKQKNGDGKEKGNLKGEGKQKKGDGKEKGKLKGDERK
jgi:hypothetical protein